MARNINGNQDGKKGGNETYTIPGRGTISRIKAVKEVKKGKHPLHTTTKINGKEYVKAKPNPTTKDTGNKER
ncbi:MAG: hypothetical protein WA945_11615 [Arcobacteraceae bacterium]